MPYIKTANTLAIYLLEDVNDSSGNGKTLTNNNTVTFTPAKFGNGANLGNANTNKSLSSTDKLGIDGGVITISCWVKNLAEIASAKWSFFTQCSNTSKVEYRLQYNYNAGTRQLNFIRCKMGVAEQMASYNLTMGTANFYHIVFTYDGTNIRGYVNGALVAGPTAVSGSGNASFTEGIAIGMERSDGLKFSSSLIDEVIIENVAWSLADVQRVYNRLLRKINGLSLEQVKTVNGLAIASVKTVNGLVN